MLAAKELIKSMPSRWREYVLVSRVSPASGVACATTRKGARVNERTHAHAGVEERARPGTILRMHAAPKEPDVY